MSVERYALDTGEMEVHRNGGYVLHADYEELERYGRQADITIENLELKLADSQREFRAADATIENLQMQVEKLAAENAGLKAFGDKLYSMYKGLETSGGGFHDEQSIPYQQAAIDAAISAFEEIKTPATDASLNEFLAHGVELFAESQKEYVRKNRSELDSMTRAAYCGSAVDAERFAAQLRKGVQS